MHTQVCATIREKEKEKRKEKKRVLMLEKPRENKAEIIKNKVNLQKRTPFSIQRWKFPKLIFALNCPSLPFPHFELLSFARRVKDPLMC